MTNTPKTPTVEPSETPEVSIPVLPAELASRFITAVGGADPTPDQVAIVRQNAGAIESAAAQIATLPDGRYKALALTSLEEALMWANKAVFA